MQTELHKAYLYSLVPGILRCTGTLVSHPLELVKVRIQTTPAAQGKLKTFLPESRNMGIQGLYRGYTATLFSYLFKVFYKYPLLILGPELVQKHLGQKNPIIAQMTIAPLVVVTDTFLQGPFRRLRYVAITSNRSTFSVFRHFIKTKAKLWYGSKAYLIKHAAGSGGLLFTDAYIRKAFKDRNMEVGHKNPVYIGVMALNGVFLSTVTTPFDVIATKMGSKNDDKPYRGFISTVLSLYKHEGFRGFMKGWSIRILPRVGTVVYMGLSISWGRSIINSNSG